MRNENRFNAIHTTPNMYSCSVHNVSRAHVLYRNKLHNKYRIYHLIK